MNLEKQSPGEPFTGLGFERTFKSAAIHTNPRISHWMLTDFGRASERTGAARMAHEKSRFVDSPTAAFLSSGSNMKLDRSAQNLADWSSYLPAECIAVMVALGWNRTT
jgi:hypothetical protein